MHPHIEIEFHDPENSAVLAQILSAIKAMETRIMSAISDFVDKQNAHNTAVDAALDTINTSVADIVTEVANLNATITQLQNSAGTITPADQALLDAAQASGQALETKAAAAAAAAKAADTLTPPVAPPAAAS